jgi:hypothetical protein
MKSKRSHGFALVIVLSLLSVAWAVPVLADSYTIGGDVQNPGSYSATGSLWSALNGSATVANPTGPQENGISNDYVQVNGSNGSQIFSVSEIDPSYNGNNSTANPTVVANGAGGFNLTSTDGRNVTGITSMQVVDAVPTSTNGGQVQGDSKSVTIFGAGIPTTVYNSVSALNAAGTDPSGGVTATYNHQGSHTVNFQGPTLLSILQNLGGDAVTQNLNNIVVFQATDGYSTILSMAEIDEALNSKPVLLATEASDGSINGTGNPDDGMARLVITGETTPGPWVSNLLTVEVETVPEPISALLFAPGLVLIWAARRRLATK